MTTDELKAAAERLLACNGELEWKEQYEGNENHDFNDDVDDVAKCFLARLAADEQRERGDAEPITEEWALQNGGGRDDGGGFAWKIWERGQGESTEEPAFHVLWSESLWLECYSATGDTLGIIELMTPPTRGQLRKLLEALKGRA